MDPLASMAAWFGRGFPPGRRAAPGAILGGAVALTVLSVLNGATFTFAPFAQLLARPGLAFSVLVGPTGLTFPCWAVAGSRARAAPALLSS